MAEYDITAQLSKGNLDSDVRLGRMLVIWICVEVYERMTRLFFYGVVWRPSNTPIEPERMLGRVHRCIR